MSLLTVDPLALADQLWPNITFYQEQEDIIYSVEENVETYVTAGNKLGKDFVTAFICLSVFLRALKEGVTCRIITTSVKEDHLRVLWGEIGRFVTSAKYPLLADKGGPLTINHQEIRRADEAYAKNPINYLIGMVAQVGGDHEGEGLAGHHAEITLAVGDEASGLSDAIHRMFQGWAKRFLYIGNPNNCNNFFRTAIRDGDLLAN